MIDFGRFCAIFQLFRLFYRVKKEFFLLIEFLLHGHARVVERALFYGLKFIFFLGWVIIFAGTIENTCGSAPPCGEKDIIIFFGLYGVWIPFNFIFLILLSVVIIVNIIRIGKCSGIFEIKITKIKCFVFLWDIL